MPRKGLDILQQKSWHVLRRHNIEKVRKDQREAQGSNLSRISRSLLCRENLDHNFEPMIRKGAPGKGKRTRRACFISITN